MDNNICELCVQKNPGVQWTIGGVSVTVESLCHAVQQLKTQSSNFSWAAVSRALGLSKSATSASSMLKKKYQQYIQPYESLSARAALRTPTNPSVSYLERRSMSAKLSDKLATIPDILFTQKKEETLCLQALRNLQFQVVKKPGEQAVGNMDYPQQIVELYNESQPFTNKLLADLLERLDEVVSLTIGPLTYLTTVPDFRLFHQSLQRLILYDLPSHLVEKVHDMAVEFLPRLHTLSILATSCHMIAPSCDEDGAGSFQGPPFLTETAIW